MAGKLSKQVKNDRPVMVNGMWVHKHLDNSPPSAALLQRFEAIGRKLKRQSA